MSEESTARVSDLQRGDQVRFPDGTGGHVWPTVLRVLHYGDQTEILFGSFAKCESKRLKSTAQVRRRAAT